ELVARVEGGRGDLLGERAPRLRERVAEAREEPRPFRLRLRGGGGLPPPPRTLVDAERTRREPPAHEQHRREQCSVLADEPPVGARRRGRPRRGDRPV